MNRMLSAALAVATLASISGAHAAYICDAPTQNVGKGGTNPVVSTQVGVDNTTGTWFAFHKLRDGTIIDRRLQYNVQAIPRRPGADLGWSGFLNKNPSLWMFGALRSRGSDARYVYYVEELHDSAHGDKLVMQSIAECVAEDMSPEPAPQYVAPAPQAPYAAPQQHAGVTTVPLTTPDNWYSQYTTVSVNGKWIKVQVDTGAYGMTMTQSLADAMVSNGDATRGEDSQVKGYDGVLQTVHHITITKLTFGGRELADVDAVVVPDSGNPLLGMDILRQFGKFTIDTANSQLILG